MDASTLSQHLKQGRHVFGKLIVSPSPRWPEAVRGCSLSFVFIDTEHIAFDRAELSWMCQTNAALGLPALVHIPAPDPYAATMVLYGGDAGVIAPYVETVEQVLQPGAASSSRHAFEARSKYAHSQRRDRAGGRARRSRVRLPGAVMHPQPGHPI